MTTTEDERELTNVIREAIDRYLDNSDAEWTNANVMGILDNLKYEYRDRGK